jgi:type I restriction enzyme S subunit
MAAEWRRATVAELQAEGVLLVEDGNHGEYRPRPDEFVDVGIAFIRAADMDAGRVLFESASKINELARQRITKGIGRRGDVLLSHKGTVGKVAFVADNAPPFVCSPQTTFWRTLDLEVLDRRYLYAYLRSPEFHAQLATRAGETDMAPYVSLTSQRGLSIALPPIDSQRAISRILVTLDDKIELNRQMNEALEAIVKGTFKSWFMAATEAGISKGWREESIYVAAEVIYGAPFSSAKFNTEGIGRPLVRIRDLADESPGVFTLEEHPKGYLLKPGDIVVGMDGEFRAHLWGGEESWLNQRVCVFAPKPGFSAPFVLNSIVALLAEVEATETATTVIHLGKNDIDRFKIVLPDTKVLKEFNRLAQPLFDRIVLNKQESRTLAALRDALLPKLLSGEINISEHL